MKMQNGVYNKAVYWPEELKTKIEKLMKRKYTITPSAHAREKIQNLKLPPKSYRIVLHGEVVEAEVQNQNVVKVITRLERKSEWREYHQDICSAIVFDCSKAIVKTMWLNSSSDTHATLNIENYIVEKSS